MTAVADSGWVALGLRRWRPCLVVTVLDGVTGLPLRSGLRAAVLDAAGREAGLRPILTTGGRIVFRGGPVGAGARVRIAPGALPFFPAEMAVPTAEAGAVPQLEIALSPTRAYAFGSAERVLRHRLMAGDAPAAGAEITVPEGGRIRAAPARTDADGEFVLPVRANGTARTAQPVASGPLPPGLAPPAAAAADGPERAALVIAWRGERRILPADRAPPVPGPGERLARAPEEAIRWEALQAAEPPPEAAPVARPRRGRGGVA